MDPLSLTITKQSGESEGLCRNRAGVAAENVASGLCCNLH